MANPPLGSQVSPCVTSPISHQVRVNKSRSLRDPLYADHPSVHAGREMMTSTCRNKHERCRGVVNKVKKKKSNTTDAAADVKHFLSLRIPVGGERRKARLVHAVT